MVLASSLSWTLALLSARTTESQNLLFADVDQVTVPSWAVCGSLCEKDELCRYLKLQLILTIPGHNSFHSFLLPNILPWNTTFCWLWDKPKTGIGALTDITEGWFASFFFFFFSRLCKKWNKIPLKGTRGWTSLPSEELTDRLGAIVL